MRAVTTDQGIGRLVDDDTVELLASPHPTLQAFLVDHEVAELGNLAVRSRAALTSVRLLAPVPAPSKLLIAGVNYVSHAKMDLKKHGVDQEFETERAEPILSLLAGSAVAGPYSPIRRPRRAPDAVDYEGEAAVVIGRRAYNVTASAAWEHVAGVTICNDVSARDVLISHSQEFGRDLAWGKSFDTFKPLGPALLTRDELDPRFDLAVKTHVNGEERQSFGTGEMVFSCAELVAYASTFLTLEPGDVISTGSADGVGMDLGVYLRPGDRVDITIERIGTLTNTVEDA